MRPYLNSLESRKFVSEDYKRYLIHRVKQSFQLERGKSRTPTVIMLRRRKILYTCIQSLLPNFLRKWPPAPHTTYRRIYRTIYPKTSPSTLRPTPRARKGKPQGIISPNPTTPCIPTYLPSHPSTHKSALFTHSSSLLSPLLLPLPPPTTAISPRIPFLLLSLPSHPPIFPTSPLFFLSLSRLLHDFGSALPLLKQLHVCPTGSPHKVSNKWSVEFVTWGQS